MPSSAVAIILMKKTAVVLILVAAVAAASYAFLGKDDMRTDGEANEIPRAQSSMDSQAIAEAYIRENISRLSPEEEVIGGEFYVSGIEFSSDRGGSVAYGDGHNSFVADFAYKINADGDVTVDLFESAEDFGGFGVSGEPFDESGNITANNSGSGWDLVYEKPGQPALRIDLSFLPVSECIIVAERRSCESVAWEVGARVRITGMLVGETVNVTTLTIL